MTTDSRTTIRMFFEARLDNKRLSAIVTAMRPLARMPLHLVVSPTGTVGECVVAIAARNRPLIGVNPQMLRELELPLKGRRAVVTGIGSRVVVYGHMISEEVVALESRAALRASEVASTGFMHRTDVPCDVRAARKLGATTSTAESPLARVLPDVIQ